MMVWLVHWTKLLWNQNLEHFNAVSTTCRNKKCVLLVLSLVLEAIWLIKRHKVPAFHPTVADWICFQFDNMATAFRNLVCIFMLNTYFRRVRFDCLDSFGWNLSTMVLKMANHVNDAMQEISLAWINVQIGSGLGVECLLKDVFVAANVSFWREFLLYSWLILVGEGMTNTITTVNLAKVRRMNTQKLPSSPWDSALLIFATGLRSERTRDQEGMGWFKQNAEMLLFFRKLMWVLRSHVFFVNTDTIHLYMLLPIS